ncbi:MAG: hypothetical protein ACK5XN_21120 [Bacteroidota bacterium]|jgi:hypothetical protein
MANTKTFDITFAYLSEYSSPISVYDGSLLQPLSINVGYWFATGNGTVSVLASYDNVIYTTIYTTTASNNSIIYLSVSSFVGAFIKLQRSSTTLTIDRETTIQSSENSPVVLFSAPETILPNDDIYGVSTIYPFGGDPVRIPFKLGTTKQSTVQSYQCALTSNAWATASGINITLSIVRQTPDASGTLICSTISPNIVSVNITY